MQKNYFSIQGSSLLFISTILYGLYGLYSRLIGDNIGTFFVFVCRALVMICALLTYLKFFPSWKPLKKQDYKWFVSMVTPGLAAIILIFLSFNKLPLGTVYFVIYACSTLFSYLIGKLFFGEKLTNIKIISLFLCLLGLLTIYRDTIGKGDILYLLLAVIGGGGMAAWNIFSKKVTAKYSLVQVLTIDSITTVVFALPLAFLFGETISLPTLTTPWLIVFIFGITAVGAGLLTIGGFKLVEAQKGSLIMLSEPVFGSIFGYLFFRETFGSLFFIGALLIMVGMALPFINLNKLKKYNLS